jgi:hypothetical protein
MDAATSTSIAVAAGVAVPVIVSFLKNVNWSAKVKQGLSFAISLIIALGITVYDNGVDIDSWDALVANLGVIFTTSQVWYTQLFEGTKANGVLEEKIWGN